MITNFYEDLPQDKSQRYLLIIEQLKALKDESAGEIANMANWCALLKNSFNWLWVGFYLVQNNRLVLGPFQGPVACTTIEYGKGVCGNAWKDQSTFIVPNVHEFEGHIACSSLSNSEIVVPFQKNHEVIGVLDIDSELFSHFDDVDATYLEILMKVLFNK